MKRATTIGTGVALMVVAVIGAVVLLATRDDRAPTDEVASEATGPDGDGTTVAPDGPVAPEGTAGSNASTVEATAPPTTGAAGRSFTIAATGDFLIHSTVADAARTPEGGYDFTPLLTEVTPLIEGADLAVCHLEVPLSVDNGDLSGYPVFSAPRELAGDIAEAGYDTCSTVSNHALDRGFTGVVSTLDALDAAGVAHAGTARTAEEAAAATLVEVNGVAVAHLAYAYGFNGVPIPAEAPWSVNALDAERIVADAAAARAAGAEFVMISLQWGAEYQRTPTAEQEAVAATVLGSPEVDLIIGHHVHVVQPVGMVGTKVVAYGLGNFLSNQSPEAGLLPDTQDGVILHLTVTEDSPGTFSVAPPTFTPTFVDRGAGHVIRVVDATSNAASYERTVGAMTALGAPGVRPDR